MSFIQFESGTDKEKARHELREAREQLLKRAEDKYKLRQEKEIQKKLRGDDQWMLPSVSQKIASMSEKSKTSSSSSKKSKKEKHLKRKKQKDSKEKKRKKKNRSSSSNGEESSTSDTDGEDTSRRMTSSKKKRNYSSDSSQDEWVEKVENDKIETPLVRDDWMSGILVPTYSRNEPPEQKDVKKGLDSYDPSRSARELNPFWKNGGSGLPTFLKPNSDSEGEEKTYNYKVSSNTGHWRKKAEYEGGKPSSSKNHNYGKITERKFRTSRSGSREKDFHRTSRSRYPRFQKDCSKSPKRHSVQRRRSRSKSISPAKERSSASSIVSKQENTLSTMDFLTDQQMNELGAKIIKAEIMGSDDIAKQLKEKLEKAREYRSTHKTQQLSATKETQSQLMKMQEKEVVLLTTTNSKGVSRPVQKYTSTKESDLWGGRKGKKVKKVETHLDGERIRYFADDDKYDIKRMFESEKFSTSNDQDEQFANIAGKYTNPNDDLEDIFAEKVRKGMSQHDLDKKERARAIQQHEEFRRTLESCLRCFDSAKMEKQLIVSIGTSVYLSLPWHEPLQPGHCLIIPQQHVSCSSQLDEDVWCEITQYQQALCNMFRSRSQDCVFFETARYLHKRPHMIIHCVPNRDFELAPFYFKKAIQESEREWSTNKQLIALKEKNVRRSVPKGLPYFWVNFGMDNGFAHIIEEQDRFPNNFAQEIIGGLLNLDARLWRRPRREPNPIPKVKQFADWWKPYDPGSK